MMTNEETKEELSRLDIELTKMVDCGNKASERMSAGRRRKAVELAIEALENQPKYEKALELACEELVDVTDYSYPRDIVLKAYITRYKNRAGLEG